MLVSFYSSRIILEALGVNDFGIYNLVGGIVAVFSFLQNALSGATSSYFSFYLGKNENNALKLFFSNALSLHIVLAFFFVILSEFVGIYFLDKIVKIPIDKHDSAMWVFHFTIFTVALNIITLPFNSLIISHENMGFYAFQGILKSSLVLIFSISLLYYSGNRLILYSFLIFLVSIILFALIFINVKFRYKNYITLNLKKEIILPLFNFFKWDLFGNFSFAINSQGIGIVLNFFFGAIINGVIGIANQVNVAVNVFVSSFMMAVKPQIIKAYANDDFERMQELIEQLSKFSFYLMLIIASPVLFKLDFLLALWLKKVPEFTHEISTLVIIGSFFNVFILPFGYVIHATGKMKRISFISGTFYLMVIPISYILLKIENYYLIPFIVNLFALLLVSINNIHTAKKYVPSLKLLSFSKNVLLPMLYCIGLNIICGYLLNNLLNGSFFKDILMILILILFNIIIIYYVGVSNNERKMLLSFLKNKFK